MLLLLAGSLALLGCGKRISEDPDSTSSSTGGGTASGASASSPSTVTRASTRITPPAAAAPSREGWNAAQIPWQPYEAGLAEAKAEKKPVVLIFSTTWCPHCKNFSHVFEDPRVVASTRDFVMVHLDADVEEAIASKYALDGTYIPRTFFLTPDGRVDGTIHAQRPRSQFFYDEFDPSQLLASMDVARKKLALTN